MKLGMHICRGQDESSFIRGPGHTRSIRNLVVTSTTNKASAATSDDNDKESEALAAEMAVNHWSHFGFGGPPSYHHYQHHSVAPPVFQFATENETRVEDAQL